MSDNSPPPLRILWIDIDSLRPDHLGCYGYPRPTSPCIDELAAEGVRFDGLYTSDSPCLPSRSALQTGLFGIHNGAVSHGGTAADPFSEGLRRGFRSPRAHGSLAAVLSRAGLWTTTISVFGQHHSALHWYAGFNEAIQDGYNTWSAEGVGRHALDWLARNADRDRWFLHVHVWDPHTPYTGTLEDAEVLGGGRPDWVTEEVLARHRTQGGPHSAAEVMG
ncbi:MAG: sulfatase-like hydrolase/transferase, partial [Acidimicrobiales bacterium]|nr:sulfatase-like hydrolase/transferase [Acidimicrobiales bacterium]